MPKSKPIKKKKIKSRKAFAFVDKKQMKLSELRCTETPERLIKKLGIKSFPFSSPPSNLYVPRTK